MIYLRNIFTQDLRDGKQIAFPTEPSNILFKFSFSNKDPDRKISFIFKEKDNNSPYYVLNGKTINTRLYSAGSEARIDGELKHFLKVNLNAKVDDVILFRAINLISYEFELIPQGATLYSSYKALLNGKNHEVALEHFNNEHEDNNFNNTLSVKNVDLGNLKEDFADWFIKQDGIKHNYFTDSFSANRKNLLEQLTKYETIYKEQFGITIFSLPKNELNEFLIELEKNLYLENGVFFQFSLKTSTHMPRAILGKKNYIKFLKEILSQNDISQRVFNFKTFHKNTKDGGLIFSEKIVARFVASLLTKPFVICSGLSGSGKTKLAQAFVQWITESAAQYKIIPVGADWTNREPLLGYPNAIETDNYVVPENGALEILIKAIHDKKRPYFLILDEMNLSHVERYFADFLSAMESGEAIPLHNIEKIEKVIPQSITLPKNLFIIGTVNIDETTYMFSPKVLDRANTIEFRLNEEDLTTFFDSPLALNMNVLKNKGADQAESFVIMATNGSAKDFGKLKVDLLHFFTELKKTGAEFGYRTASEIGRLIQKLEELGETGDDLLDIAIMQKLLPKLHGSRSKLSKVLITLGTLCLTNQKDCKAKYFDQIDEIDFNDSNIRYKLSFEKIVRMYKNALDNGFASYAEA